MTKEEVKRWLYEIRYIKKMKRYHLNEIDNIKDDCERIREGKSAVLCLAKVQTSNISNPTEQAATKIIYDYDDKINYHIIEIDRVDVRVQKAIDFLKDLEDNRIINIDEYLCLIYYYFKGMDDWETGQAMGYSERQAQRIKKSALENMSLNGGQLPFIMIT